MQDNMNCSSEILKEPVFPYTSQTVPKPHVPHLDTVGGLLSSYFLCPPSRLTPLIELLHGHQKNTPPQSRGNGRIKTRELWERIADAGGRDVRAFKDAASPDVAREDEKQEKTCEGARWRDVALQQQRSLIVLRELNAALLEENAWMREHILCLNHDLETKRYAAGSCFSRQSAAPEQSHTLQQRTRLDAMKASHIHTVKLPCRFNLDTQTGYEKAGIQTGRVETRRDTPNDASPSGRFAKEELTQVSGRLDCGPCSLTACTCSHSSHLPHCSIQQDANIPLSATYAASVCRCCLCNTSSAVVEKSQRPFIGSRAPTELSAGNTESSAYSRNQLGAMQQKGALTRDQSACGARGRTCCKDEQKRDEIDNCHSRRKHAQSFFIRRTAAGESLECQSCPRLLSLAHEWARCAAVLELYRLKDLQEIACLESHLEWMKNDISTCGSCSTPSVDDPLARRASVSQELLGSTLCGEGANEKECLFVHSSSISRPSVAMDYKGQNISSIESLLRTPTPCSDLVDAARNCHCD